MAHNVVELSEEQLLEQYVQEQATPVARSKGVPLHKDSRTRTEQLLRWKRDRIWIINGTGDGLLVYVHPLFKIKQVMEEGYKLSLGTKGVSGEVALKAALEAELLQEFNIPAADTDMARVNLGPSQSPAYVTAHVVGSPTRLFCKNIIVKGGHCVTIRGPAYDDKELADSSECREESDSLL